MAEPIARSVVDSFYRALGSRDAKVIAAHLDENVDWTVIGPVDLLGFCGRRNGRAAVMDMVQHQVPAVLTNVRLVPEIVVVDGDRAAIFAHVHAEHRDSGRAISHHISHFMRFAGGKVVEYKSMIDSLDAAEQLLGFRLKAPSITDGHVDTGSNLVEI